MKRALLLAMVLLALVFVATSTSIRLTADGIDCQPWPACYGQQATADAVLSQPSTRALPVLSLTCLAAYGACAIALPFMVRCAAARLPFPAFLLAGSAAIWPAHAWSTLAQTLGGMACLAMPLPLLVTPREEPAVLSRAGRFAFVSLVLLLALQAATGTLISARSAGATCAVSCDITWLPGALALFNPLQAGSAIDLLRNTAGGPAVAGAASARRHRTRTGCDRQCTGVRPPPRGPRHRAGADRHRAPGYGDCRQ